MYLDRLAARLAGGFLLAEGDGTGAGAGAGGEQGGAAGATATTAATTERTIAQGGAEGGGTTGAAAAAGAPAWPENWREMFAGEDAEAKKLIERLSTPEDLRKKLVNQEKTIRSGAHKTVALPEGATEEEITAHRKAIGMPEKPGEYGFAFPEGAGVSEGDVVALDRFQKFMDERHVPPGAAKAAFDFYVQNLTEGRAAHADQVSELALEQAAELRKEFPGREFTRNFGDRSKGSIGVVGEFLAQHFEGEEKVLDEVLGALLPNGLKVGDYAPFLKGMVRMARSYAEDEALVGGDGAGGGASMDDEYTALIKKSVAEPAKVTAADRTRLEELATARIRRDERASSRRDQSGRFAA
jgi:hypothetical protein